MVLHKVLKQAVMVLHASPGHYSVHNTSLPTGGGVWVFGFYSNKQTNKQTNIKLIVFIQYTEPSLFCLQEASQIQRRILLEGVVKLLSGTQELSQFEVNLPCRSLSRQ